MGHLATSGPRHGRANGGADLRSPLGSLVTARYLLCVSSPEQRQYARVMRQLRRGETVSADDRAVARGIVNDYRTGMRLRLPLMFLIGGVVVSVGGLIAWNARHAFPGVSTLVGPMFLVAGALMSSLRQRVLSAAARQGLTE